ncbi:MAG: hypothetical protein RL154_1696, partial [Pseudomonadota bacterium]
KNYFSEGVKSYESGQYEKALEAYNKAIELSPSDWIIYAAKGDVLYKLGKYELALELYKIKQLN